MNTKATTGRLTLEDVLRAKEALGKRPDPTIIVSPHWAEWLYSELGREWVESNVRFLEN